ncbi:hypothetical protein PF005_g18543 [Phytophthora fragariae]|uniref:Uncharacterized protein n=1 Tax=Phytophthora fragariae TaxID=53985 RepID=A0A6A3XSI0_9STRA|nr:hypothetical protein PF003_g8982 [Phytophthora fragariae]KAE8930287.1 hypothetical protein PF009_g19614 [Phytophthora fragariae]KAE8979339.1 hypothetical protein PF011_g22889 [Phytophthora fragariae]KAE9074876.1 hypothetical protein PF010_g24511 [Phytophthora fragariae]KAE9092090.1 hypothetical protein PF007_g18651 [Phytophthora fragariae]
MSAAASSRVSLSCLNLTSATSAYFQTSELSRLSLNLPNSDLYRNSPSSKVPTYFNLAQPRRSWS